MVTEQRDVESEVQNGIIGTEVICPKEGFLPQLYGCREEAEHRPKYRELEQHRQTPAHRTHPCPLVEFHSGLLLLHHILFLRIFLVNLVDFRLERRHLCG